MTRPDAHEAQDASTRIIIGIAAASENLATAVSHLPPELRAALAVALVEIVRWFIRRTLKIESEKTK